ncbi:hypothetical protein K439DRAFT_1665734 [Ramaria rubella]|nr:hypothetical protein K439DRAFT_1665734 [Ramaria rubella]
MPKASKKTSRRVTGSVTTYHVDGTTTTSHQSSSGLRLARSHENTAVQRRAIYQNSSISERQILRDLHPADASMGWDVINDTSDAQSEDLNDNIDAWVDESRDAEAVGGLAEEIYQLTGHRTRIDSRNRRDRVLRRNLAWQQHLPALVQRFLQWDRYGAPQEEEQESERHPPLPVHDLLECIQVSLPRQPGEEFTVTLARHGYLGSSPIHPETAFSFQLMHYFKTLSTRCPQLSAQSFVKSICEIQSVLYRPSLRNKFSDAYDVYVTICAEVQRQVSTMLGQDAPDWRLKNACPACTYKLDGEPSLKISMEVTMDSYNTQKCVERNLRDTNEAGEIVSSTNIERTDHREVHGDYYLSPQEVDRFAHEVKRRLPPADASRNEIHRLATTGMEGRPVDGADEPTPCIEKWTNLSRGYKENVGDISRDCGELAKYPLAIMNKLVDVFGHDLMCGYDIGCGFSITANNSPLLGGKLQEKRTRFCCGSFHGHAHCRLCQLDWHPLYIEGSGLEEYEGCERAFSDSNGTGRRTRYATRFHRKQILVLHFERWDKDRYQELSRFLLNNYRQAMKNLALLPDQLEAAKRSLNIDSDVRFEEWREAEKAYLRGLKTEPELDVLKIEYLSTLIKLRQAETDFSRVSQQWELVPVEELRLDNYYRRAEKHMRHLETGRSQALELLLTLRKALFDLEHKLGIYETWMPACQEWQETEKYMNMRTYQRALDTLESLVVAKVI